MLKHGQVFSASRYPCQSVPEIGASLLEDAQSVTPGGYSALRPDSDVQV